MTQLINPSVPFPDIRALGYQGHRTLVAFWWEPGVDELSCYDGAWLTCGMCDNYMFIDWWRAMGWPQEWEIGDAVNSATNVLLVDAVANTLILMDRHEACKKLRLEALRP